MDKQALHNLLQNTHHSFIELIASLDEQSFCKTVGQKWTAGQQADHLHKAVSPVNMAFQLPLFVPKLLFGKANRPSKNYEALVEKYKLKLNEGGKASGRFVPPTIPFIKKNGLVRQLQKDTATLCKWTLKKNETDLDKYILPHPLLGKLTFREMLYFTAYHVQHHHQLVKQILET
jgi:hypothetical protein